MGELVIKPLARTDLSCVAELHAVAFPDGALTALGRDVLERYYAWLLDKTHDAQLMGAWDGTELAGFCAAGVFRGAMNGFLRANRRFLAYRVLTRPSLLRQAWFRQRLRSGLAITVRYSRRLSTLVTRSGARKGPQESSSASFGVLAIATLPSVRGRGVGRALMLDAEARARKSGFERMTLTVHPENSRAVRFYRDLGWLPVTKEGVWSGIMQRFLDRGP